MKVSLTSDNKILEQAFTWAVDKTPQFVMTGKSGMIDNEEDNIKPYKPSYYAGYFNRTAFYGRDFVHQAVGAQMVGLWDENYSMYKMFAENATHSRKWYTLWAMNFDGSPYYMDYTDDNDFIREIPVQFELVEKAYKQYLWSGDKRYIHDPVMWNFYTKVMTDFITMHDTTGNGIAEELGEKRGLSTYNERDNEHAIESGDAIGCQYKATIAYGLMLKERGEDEKSIQWLQKAEDLKTYFNDVWSLVEGDKTGEFACGIGADGTKYTGFRRENTWFMPLKEVTEIGKRTDNCIQLIKENLGDGIGTHPEAPPNIEAYTYLPEMFYKHHYREDGWKWIKYIYSQNDLPHEIKSQGTNGNYPEISFTMISNIIEGMLGVEPNGVTGAFKTLPSLPQDIHKIAVKDICFGSYVVDLTFLDNHTVTMTNKSNQAIQWQCSFYGIKKSLLVDEMEVTTTPSTLNGNDICETMIIVPCGKTVKIKI